DRRPARHGRRPPRRHLAAGRGPRLRGRPAPLPPDGRGRVMPTLDTALKGVVGDKTAKALAAGLDLHTIGDLLYHFPRRYDERGEHTDLGSLVVGEDVTVLAQVQ